MRLSPATQERERAARPGAHECPIRFLSATEYRRACALWEEVVATTLSSVGDGSPRPPLTEVDLVRLARALHDYSHTSRARRLWRRLTAPPDALPFAEFVAERVASAGRDGSA